MLKQIKKNCSKKNRSYEEEVDGNLRTKKHNNQNKKLDEWV